MPGASPDWLSQMTVTLLDGGCCNALALMWASGPDGPRVTIRLWKAKVIWPKKCLHEHTWPRPRGEQKTGGQRARGQTPKQKHSPLTFQRPGTWHGRMLAGLSPERAAPVEDTVSRKDFNHTSQTEIALTGSSQGPRAKERVPNTEEEH